MSSQRFAGVERIGPSGRHAVMISVTFPQAFGASPVVVVSAIPESDDFTMTYSAIVLEVRPDGFTANFGAIDGSAGWRGSPSLSWVAVERSNA